MILLPSIPLRVTMTCLGCSSTGSERTRAATSSAVFHFANWPRRFWPAQTLVWMIFKNNWPERGLKINIAPSTAVRSGQPCNLPNKSINLLIGFVVKFPSKVLWLKINSKKHQTQENHKHIHSNSVNVGVINEPDDLIRKKFRVVLKNRLESEWLKTWHDRC